MKIGMMELLVIAVVALIVIGPDKLPEYAKRLGQVMKEVRKATSSLTEEIQKDVVEPLNEAAKPLKEAVEPLNEVAKDIKKTTDDLAKSVNAIGKEEIKKEVKQSVEKAAEAVQEG